MVAEVSEVVVEEEVVVVVVKKKYDDDEEEEVVAVAVSRLLAMGFVGPGGLVCEV